MPYATDLTTACAIQVFDYLLLKSFESTDYCQNTMLLGLSSDCSAVIFHYFLLLLSQPFVTHSKSCRHVEMENTLTPRYPTQLQ